MAPVRSPGVRVPVLVICGFAIKGYELLAVLQIILKPSSFGALYIIYRELFYQYIVVDRIRAFLNIKGT